MNFEVLHGHHEQKILETVASGQARVPTRLELQTPCKKVLSMSGCCFVGGVERTDSGFSVNGKVVTRVIYIDEFDAFNSEERTDTWTEKFTGKAGEEILSVVPNAHILETSAGDYAKNENGLITGISTAHIVNVALLGLVNSNVQYVGNIKGDTEIKRDKMNVSTFGLMMSEGFEISETFSLDNNTEAILGVEMNAAVRDIACSDGKITVKGMACANITAVKNADGGLGIYSNNYDWDFTKTINNKEIGLNDDVCGSVMLSNVAVKVENREKPELVIEAELLFIGNTVAVREIEVVDDAFSCSNNLDFVYSDISNTHMTVQVNTAADIEGNVTMPEGSPFIGRVLSTGALSAGGVNVIAGDGKVTVEGVLSSTLVYECEEKNIYSHNAQVPFSVNCKIEGCTAEHNISVNVTPMTCNIKARRGKELLVDARLMLNVCANTVTPRRVVSGISLGADKTRDESAFTIHIAGENETLWDIAKRTSIPAGEIVSQNPAADQGINAGDRIVLYRQQVINL